jgi:hypothetical protein
MKRPSDDRHKRRAGLILLLLLLCVSWANAQEPSSASEQNPPASTVPQAQTNTGKDSASKRFLGTIWSDQKKMWTSPFRMNARQAVTIALPLVAGTAGLIQVDEDAAKGLPNTDDQVKWSKRVSQIGSIYTLGGIVAGTMLVGKKKDDPETFNVGRSSLRALIDSIIINYSLKYATARERPLENDGQGRFWKGGDSFPSGHAMESWAVAMVVARSPKTPKWLKITSVSVATVVSLSRLGARRHFPSDIFAGGILGGLIGNYVVTH